MGADKTPRVNVIMPTYNDAHFLPKALDNVEREDGYRQLITELF